MRIRKAFEQIHAVVGSRRPDAAGSKDASRLQDDAATGRVSWGSFTPGFLPPGVQGLGMSSPSRRPPLEFGGKLSIGALSRATGIPVETLRTWEARYGFPVPERKPSGHRVYPLADIPRLRRIAEVLSRGHRAGDVVAATDEALADLLTATAFPIPEARAVAIEPSGNQSDILQAVEAFDTGRLTRILLQDWARLGPLDFLRTRVAPVIREVGDACWLELLETHHRTVRDLLARYRGTEVSTAGDGFLATFDLSGRDPRGAWLAGLGDASRGAHRHVAGMARGHVAADRAVARKRGVLQGVAAA